MVRPYSLDLRERVVAAAEAGQSCRAVAKRERLERGEVATAGPDHRQRGGLADGRQGVRFDWRVSAPLSWIGSQPSRASPSGP